MQARRVCRALVASAFTTLLLAAGIGMAGIGGSPAAVSSACKPALIGGKHKCLRAGQRCAARYHAAYRKYGFACINGRLRKTGTNTPPLATTTITTTTTAPPDTQLSSQNRVYGGGQFTGPDGIPRNFAVDAHAVPGGPAFGDIEYGNTVHASHEQVMCLTVSGNKATLGAKITQGDRPETVGFLILMVVVDNGTPLSGSADQSTLQVSGPPNDPTWPAGFPNTCPAPDTAAAFATYFPLNSGDLVVQAAK